MYLNNDVGSVRLTGGMLKYNMYYICGHLEWFIRGLEILISNEKRTPIRSTSSTKSVQINKMNNGKFVKINRTIVSIRWNPYKSLWKHCYFLISHCTPLGFGTLNHVGRKISKRLSLYPICVCFIAATSR